MTFGHSVPIASSPWENMCSPTFVESAFSADQCAELLEQVSSPWLPSLVTPAVPIPGRQAEGYRSDVVRSADQATPGKSSHALIRTCVLDVALDVNVRQYGFDLSGVLPSDSFAVMRYDHRRAGHFSAHRDVGSAFSTRKISVTVQLTADDDYLGGDLLFPFSGRRAPRAIGTMAVFPSFLTHSVTAVTAGVRHALVGWIHGPAFR